MHIRRKRATTTSTPAVRCADSTSLVVSPASVFLLSNNLLQILLPDPSGPVATIDPRAHDICTSLCPFIMCHRRAIAPSNPALLVVGRASSPLEAYLATRFSTISHGQICLYPAETRSTFPHRVAEKGCQWVDTSGATERDLDHPACVPTPAEAALASRPWNRKRRSISPLIADRHGETCFLWPKVSIQVHSSSFASCACR